MVKLVMFGSDSDRTSLNRTVRNQWGKGEYGNGYDRPGRCFINLDDSYDTSLKEKGEKYNLRWSSTQFLFSEFMDFTEWQKVFIHNNIVCVRHGFIPHQQAMGEIATILSIGKVPPQTQQQNLGFWMV